MTYIEACIDEKFLIEGTLLSKQGEQLNICLTLYYEVWDELTQRYQFKIEIPPWPVQMSRGSLFGQRAMGGEACGVDHTSQYTLREKLIKFINEGNSGAL